MTDNRWDAVDSYFQGLFAPQDAVLDAALEATAAANLPAINVSTMQGKFLHLLARSHRARAILEIGTLAGYSTIWLARALPPDGRLISLEIDPAHAAVARENIARAGLEALVDIRVAPALASLEQIAAAGEGPFDLVFIDADKVNTPHYLDWSLRLTRPGSLIIVDNVVRDGKIVQVESDDASVQGIRRALDVLSQQPNLIATAIQTVDSKGYDGMAIALVLGEG